MSKSILPCNLLVTGGAGVGKTYQLKRIQGILSKHGEKWISCAPTATASQLIDGMTIHRAFALRQDTASRQLYSNCDNLDHLKNIDVIFIDEFSMITSEILDLISNALCEIMESNQAFGGKRIVLSGDIMQLRPVNGSYFFNANSFQLDNFQVWYLHKVFRQDEPSFSSFLNITREGIIDLDFLTKLQNNKLDSEREYTKLIYFNELVRLENNKCLKNIQGPEFKFYAKDILGSKHALKELKSTMKPPLELILKKDCKIMFTENNLDFGYANGNLGLVKDIVDNTSEQYLLVLNLQNNKLIKVYQHQISNYDEFDPAYISQFPLMLGYAMTMHKAQGSSLDNVYIDFDSVKSYHRHLVYTALSRVKTMDGLFMKNFHSSMISVDHEALVFDKLLKSRNAFNP